MEASSPATILQEILAPESLPGEELFTNKEIQHKTMELLHSLLNDQAIPDVGIAINQEWIGIPGYIKENEATLRDAYNNIVQGNFCLITPPDIDLVFKEDANPQGKQLKLDPNFVCLRMMAIPRDNIIELFGGEIPGRKIEIKTKQDVAIKTHQALGLVLLNELDFYKNNQPNSILKANNKLIRNMRYEANAPYLLQLLYGLVRLQQQYEQFQRKYPDKKLLTQKELLALKTKYPSDQYDIVFSK